MAPDTPLRYLRCRIRRPTDNPKADNCNLIQSEKYNKNLTNGYIFFLTTEFKLL